MVNNYLNIILLAIIQGLTEYLPISSSGHLSIVYHLLKLNEPPLLLQLYLHLGTAMAVTIFLFKELRQVSLIPSYIFLIKILAIASIPAAVVGIALREKIELAFSSPGLLPFFFLVNSLLLLSTFYFKQGTIPLENIGYSSAFIVGVLQAVAILPGISRSGATITSGLALGFKRSTALLFSLLLSLIAISGGMIVEVLKKPSEVFSFQLLTGLIVSFLVGYISLGVLKKVILSNYFYVFGFYTLSIAFLLWLLGPFI